MKMPLTLLAQPEQSNEAIGYDPTSPLEGFFPETIAGTCAHFSIQGDFGFDVQC